MENEKLGSQGNVETDLNPSLTSASKYDAIIASSFWIVHL